MVAFLDSSALYALADQDDIHHAEALAAFSSLLDARTELVTHNYVILETAALLHRRLGKDVAERFLGDSAYFTIRWVDKTLHQRAIERWRTCQTQVSLVDALSFLVMEDGSIRDALAYDEDFRRQGFRIVRT